MYCHRCGNKLSRESLYCNRCGAKAQVSGEEEEPQTTRPSASTPRPARRRPVAPPRPAPPRPVGNYAQQYEEPYEEYEEEYEDEAEYEDESGSRRDSEEVIFRITPAFYNVGLAYFGAILLSVLVTAAAGYLRLPIGAALAFSAVFFLYPIRLHILNRRIVYTLTTIKVEIEEGIINQNTRNIPLRHIQDVSISENYKERLIGIGDVVIDSASATGKITMNNIKDPRKYADLILDQLQYWK